MPADLAKLIAELRAPPQRVEGTPVLLERGEDDRMGRYREAGNKRVQAVGRRLRQRDTGRAAWVPERRGEVRPGGIERGVVGRVAHVTEHADLVQPRAESLGRALRDRERGPRSSDVEVEEVAAQRLECRHRGVRALVDERRGVIGHEVMMPRIARPAVKSAAKPSATDWPRGARSRRSDAANGMASTTATPYSTWSRSRGGCENATSAPSRPCTMEAMTAMAIAPRKPGVGPELRKPRKSPQSPMPV